MVKKVYAAVLLCLLMVSLFALPAVAQAQEGKTVRVGWYESSFNTTDRFGRKSGYAYEYQQKIAAYTGWNYEYVVESWPKLLQMLMNGEIDLLSDVSYTAERSERMLFPSLAMGAEEYFVFVPSQNTAGIQGEDISSFNGKRIAVNQGSIQEVLLRDWADKNNLQIEIIPLTVGEADSIVMMNRGEFDARVSVHSISNRYDMMPVCKIGHSDIFFAVNRARPDLLQDLNFAMGKIYDENSYYNQYLRGKYISFAGANLFLTVKEQQWLTEHGPIRVGYRDNYMAFCAQDKDTGELTGALKDFLSMASRALKNAKIDFEAVPFRTTSDALEALQRGEVDCIFPVNFSDYDGEELGLLITSPLMQTDMVAVVRESSQRKISMQEKLTVAVNEGNPNYDIFLMDSFPNWNRVYFKDTNACIEAVADDRADCLIASNFRVNSLAALMEKYDLTAISTGKALRCTFAVRHEDGNLYAILNKVANVVPPSSVNTALAFYSQEEQPLIPSHLLRKNAVPMLTGIGIIVVVILLLLLRSIRSEQRTRKALDDVAVLNETLSGSQKELKAALHDAEQANLAKTRFLANMSHELRTPMNAIIGLNTIALKAPNLTPYIREHLEKIGISAKHLLCIIESILDIRRIESGRMKVKEVDFSFRDFLNQINMIVNGQCENKGLQYDSRIIGKVEDRYVGDDAKLKRVLINILDNAVKFTEVPGTVTFTVEQTTCFENYRSLCFIIRDTGIGISKEFLPKIFDNFAQDVKRKDNVYGSTGLGLAISKNILALMNGDIQVDSEPGVGTTFTVTLSLKAAEPSLHHDDTKKLLPDLHALAAGNGQEVAGGSDGTAPAKVEGCRVLVVEDMDVNAEILMTILEMKNVWSERAKNGKEAIGMFSEHPARYYDAILMDIRMPVMDGLEATRAIRALKRSDAKEIPIVAMTANAFDEDVQHSLQAGMNAHLSKPVDPEHLYETLSKFIRR